MRYIYFIISILIFSIILGFGKNNSESATTKTRPDFKKYYDKYKVKGSFLLFDQKKNRYIVYNQEQTKQLFTPASTFKICNSLIGLETGVIKDSNFVIKWDSVIRQNVNWNKDHDLKTAYKNSTVWYYQELARRVGGEKMKYWLDKVAYGNKDTTGGIDRFWLTGDLRITAEQQIDFLRRLHDDKLPFTKRTIDIVKSIMIDPTIPNCVFRAKTGWGSQGNQDIGWYVGYVEVKNRVYYFANCIQTSDFSNQDFAMARKEIVYQILRELKILKK